MFLQALPKRIAALLLTAIAITVCSVVVWWGDTGCQVYICYGNGSGERVGRGRRHRWGQPEKLPSLVSSRQAQLAHTRGSVSASLGVIYQVCFFVELQRNADIICFGYSSGYSLI